MKGKSSRLLGSISIFLLSNGNISFPILVDKREEMYQCVYQIINLFIIILATSKTEYGAR